MKGTSLTPQQEKLKALQELLPEAFAEGKIDWEKLKATLGEDINFSNERYVLNWAGKSDAFKVLQTPTTKTLVPAKDESIHFDTTENIFIEGENLEVLKVLQKSYFGKVKMIYIDPPYNTGNDSFIYPDKFSETKAEYEKRVGDKDEKGYMTKDGMFKKNSKENGQYHSNWLNMMMPRLYLAKNLLTKDGVIFVSIDDNEVHNLRLLMNEIFGEENFVGEFIRQSKVGGGSDSKFIVKEHEYVLCYSKNINLLNEFFIDFTSDYLKRYKEEDEKGKYFWDTLARPGLTSPIYYDIETPDGTILNDGWIRSKKRFEEDYKNGEIKIFKKNDGSWSVHFKQRLNELGKKPRSFSSNFGGNIEGKKDIISLFENDKIFSYPKPVSLLNQLLKFINDKDSIILDFFAGSGTTAHAVMELNKEDGGNRKYICVQLPELCDEKSEAYKAGYQTIADICKERIRRAGKKAIADLGLRIEELNKKIDDLGLKISELKCQLPTENNKSEIQNHESEILNLKSQIQNHQSQDIGFKVLKLADSNFKQWQQIEGKDAKALTEQMQLFIDPVAENATIENMVYEFLLKSGKDLNSKIEKRNDYFVINNSELIMLLESVSQTIIEQVIGEKPMKVIALDKLFKDNDQLKTNTVLQMRDAGIEFKTV